MEITKINGILDACSITGDSPLLSGHAGIGKTEIIKQWAQSKGYFCEVLIGSLLEPSDILGMPYIENNVTHFAEPVFMHRMREKAKQGIRSVLFLDELTRIPTDTKSALLTLILDKEINGHKLPELDGQPTLIVAGMNPYNDGDYQVDSLDPAMRNRFLIISVEADATSWLKYARDTKVNQIVRDYIAENPTKLYFESKDQDELALATPRSWWMLGKFVDNFKTINPELHFEIIKGKIGSALGSQFYNFVLNHINVVKVEDIEKFVKKQKSITAENIDDIGAILYKDLLENIETVTQMELVHQLADKYLKTGNTREQIMPLLVMLYGLNLETLASILKEYKVSRADEFTNVLSPNDFNKNLFRKIVTKIKV